MGQDVTRVMDLDVLQFNALVATMTRLHYRQKEEDAWIQLVAAGQDQAALTKIVNGWRETLDQDLHKLPNQGDGKKFESDLGKMKKAAFGANSVVREMTNAGILGKK